MRVAGGFRSVVAATVLRLLNATARFGPRRRSAPTSSTCAWRRTTCYRSCWRCARARGVMGMLKSAERSTRRPDRANARRSDPRPQHRRRTRRSVGSDGPVHRCVRASVSRQSGRDRRGATARTRLIRICPSGVAPRGDRDAVPHARRGGVSTRDQSARHRRGTEPRDGARVYRQDGGGETERGGGGRPRRRRRRAPPAAIRPFATRWFPHTRCGRRRRRRSTSTEGVGTAAAADDMAREGAPP